MGIKGLWIFLLLAPLDVLADDDGFPEFFCQPAASAKPPSGYCEDNNSFIKAAETCLSRLRGEVNREQELVKHYFSVKEKDQQSHDFEEGRFNHKQASLRLARLLRLTKKTAMEIDTYFDAVYFPTDAEQSEVNGGNFEKFVLEEPCYGGTVRTLESVIQDVVQIGRDLKQAKGVADKIAGVLDASDTKITNLAGQKIEKGREPASAGAPPVRKGPRGKTGGSASTITGDVHKEIDVKELNKK